MSSAQIPVDVLQKVAYSGYQTVLNRRKPITLDRKQMPWLSFLNKRKKTSGQFHGSVVVKLKKNGGLDLQFFNRRDRLAFGEPSIELETEFPFANVHMGMELVHEDLQNMGYSIVPNGPRGKNFAKPIGEDEANRLVDYFEEIVEDMMDSYDVKMDQCLLRDGSYDTKAFVGLDGLLAVANTAGTIGGKSRANPLLQHVVYTGATVTASGTLQTLLARAKRNANLNNRGRAGSIDFMMAGADFIEGYIAYAKANGLEYQWKPDGALRGLDIGIPESAIQWEGIPIVHNPTFEILDSIETATPTWSKRCYLLASKTWQLAHAGGLDKNFSAPLDPSDQRVSRLSLDGRYVPIVTVPNANALVSIA